MNDYLGSYWRDEHGHLYRVTGTTGYDGFLSEVTLTYVPPQHQRISFREFRQRFYAENPPGARETKSVTP